jgi:hypothetical protein
LDLDPDHGRPRKKLRPCAEERKIDRMLRVLALLCSLALSLAPFGPARAESACAMLAWGATQDVVHAAHGSDHQIPAPAHHSSAQACKQLCTVVAILSPPEPVAARSVAVRPSPRPAARLRDSQPPDPSERPPKRLV